MWIDLVRYCAIGSTLLAGLLAIVVHTRVSSAIGRAMLWYFYLRALAELLSFITSAYNINNMLLFYIFCFAETLLVTYIFTLPAWMESYMKMAWIAAALILAGIIIESTFTLPDGINTWSRMAESIFFFLLCSLAASKIMRLPAPRPVYNLPEYWLAMGLVVYFGTHLWVALTSNYSMQTFGQSGSTLIWVLNSAATLVANAFILCCLYYLQRKPAQ